VSRSDPLVVSAPEPVGPWGDTQSRGPFTLTYADAVVGALKEIGVRRLWGMPGGGSNADLIQATVRAALPFSLAHTECASAFMATAQAEITGRPGACLATLGPGAAAMTNGVANAHLDRVPLVVLTDCRTEGSASVMEHQTLSHGAIFASMVKWSGRPQAGTARRLLQTAMDAVTSPPPGPVHLDLTTEFTSAMVSEAEIPLPMIAPTMPRAGSQPPVEVEQLLRASCRPVLLLGLGARSPTVAAGLRTIAVRFGIPVLVTYKAKGVVPDAHPWFAGVLTNGALERAVLERADLFLAVGLDPVELLPRPWEYPQPIVAINAWSIVQRQLPVRHEVVGDVPAALAMVSACLPARTQWDGAEVARLAEAQRSRMRVTSDGAQMPPYRVVELVADAYGAARVTVDAGAHMFPVMSLWPARDPCGLLISNGLATMGFALPAAIGAALIDRQPTIAFTGDGGLLMCVAELLTAVRERLPVRVVVFDDAALSLIEIKQRQRGYESRGVAMGRVDWEAVGRGFGVTVRQAADAGALARALDETRGDPGPVLIAARIAADTYGATMRALRG
jgi:acetolactate synthase I/II/III large subunit